MYTCNIRCPRTVFPRHHIRDINASLPVCHISIHCPPPFLTRVSTRLMICYYLTMTVSDGPAGDLLAHQTDRCLEFAFCRSK